MSDSATLAVTLSVETVERLAAIAEREQSTPGALAAVAVADFLAREAAIMAAIERGLTDLRAGRVFTQAEVMADVRSIIETARARQ